MVKTIVIDDVAISRELTVAALSAQSDITVIGQAKTCREAERATLSADVALLRADLPTDNLLEAVKKLITVNPSLKIIIIGLKKSEAAALAFIEVGAMGCVFEGDSFVKLVRTIAAAHDDRVRLSGRMAASLIQRLQQLRAMTAQLDHVYRCKHSYEQLTTRERQVLKLIGQGKTNRKIALELYIELGTVKNHVHNILKKLQVRSRRDAAAFLALQEDKSAVGMAFGD